MSMAAVAIGSAVAGIGSSIIGANAASSAADKQSAAAHEANMLQQQQYDQTRADHEPWRQAGMGALSQLGNPDFQRDFSMNDFNADPGYAFRMQEGQKALERSAAARGGLMGGAGLKALTRYGQDYGSNEYQNAYNRFNNDRTNRFNRLSSIAGLGQTANNAISAAGQNYANNAGNNMMGAANAQGAAGIAGANAWGGALSGLGKNWMQYSMMNQGGGGGGVNPNVGIQGDDGWMTPGGSRLLGGG